MFEVTREILQEAGPDVAQDREDGSPSLAALAVGILNDHLRPVLSKWHPLLDDRMAIRPPDVGPNQWEAEWGSNEEVRDELNRLRQLLRNYLRLLGAAAGTKTFARVLTPE